MIWIICKNYLKFIHNNVNFISLGRQQRGFPTWEHANLYVLDIGGEPLSQGTAGVSCRRQYLKITKVMAGGGGGIYLIWLWVWTWAWSARNESNFHTKKTSFSSKIAQLVEQRTQKYSLYYRRRVFEMSCCHWFFFIHWEIWNVWMLFQKYNFNCLCL